jgi:truncated hemoglobin YjbI
MKQISIQITDETARQMAALAKRWGLPQTRHNTPVIERAIATVFMFEIGTDQYKKVLELMHEESDTKGKGTKK